MDTSSGLDTAKTFKPEKILLCLDVGSEAVQDVAKFMFTLQALKRFAHMKLSLSKRHKIGICLITNCAQWHLSFTSDLDMILRAIESIHPVSDEYRECDLRTIFKASEDHFPDKISGDNILRFILVYFRNNTIPILPSRPELRRLYDNYSVWFDVIYWRDRELSTNKVQKVYEELAEVDIDDNDRCWVFETRFGVKRLPYILSKLIGHPEQRYSTDFIIADA
ncbi:hypothetical protein BJ742DRAFT_313364 [Cladochytrium replicatum]|nr:hypothetical protein BJ742DRAFT_313364 [Cladochytrium replicatum]